MIDYSLARTTMVDNQLRTSNITDRRLLAVMGRIPREIFVPDTRRSLAYIDEAHLLSKGPPPRYLGAPAPFARLVQLGEILETDRVLDIGCGTGYSTAVLASLAAEVVGVESDADLAVAARANLSGLGIANASIVEADLATGPKGRGGFDVVIVEGALTGAPEALFAQLNDGGRLVALIRSGPTASANVFVKAGKDVTARTEFNTTLPPLAAVKLPEQFVF
jgi:protein-L-isoaspartate(D-aspartate) O-methyltransferase